MKMIARSHFWWQGLDKSIEDLGRSCQTCQANKHSPSSAPLHMWVRPDSLWGRLRADFAELLMVRSSL
jgi:hypothetical protein